MWNHTRTDVMDLRTNAIDDFRIATLEAGLPRTRWNITASTDIGDITLFGRLSWRGSSEGDRGALPERQGGLDVNQCAPEGWRSRGAVP